ncbi:MAG TPA: sigma-70 family RNA polymerase sigma factor [Polyangia bacterium]|nr:sigma-70 family RNA polymerase sigma factor [Polyangia bacterium]
MAQTRAAPNEAEVALCYREHGHVVLRRARAILGDEEEARDVVQEVFMSLLDRPEQFDGRSHITTWLYAVTTNACFTRLRNRRTRQRLISEQPAPAAAAGASAETTTLVRQWLEQLPDELATVAVYAFVDEMTQQEIADQLGGSRRRISDLLRRIEETVRIPARGARS